MKIKSLVLVSSLILLSTQAEAARAISAQPKPSRPQSSLRLNSQPKAGSSHDLGKDSNPSPQTVEYQPLNEFDTFEVEVSAQNFPQLQLIYQRHDAETNQPKGQGFSKPLKANEEIYLWQEEIYFDKWGNPGTDLAEFNSFQQAIAREGENKISIVRSELLSNVIQIGSSLKENEIDMLYNGSWIPSEIDFLEDDAVVNQIFYLAFKSECTEESFCPAYAIAKTTENILITLTSGEDATAQLIERATNDDPNPTITNIPLGFDQSFVKNRNEVYKIIVKQK